MRAFAVNPDDTDRFDAIDQDPPQATGRDLLVRVEAVSVNPIDYKVRAERPGQVLGWDASGVVQAVGDQVERFKVGDQVYYAGDVTRPGANAALHLVDERVVGRKPERLSHLEAAALPLTTLTAWEGLYEQLRVTEGSTLLVINCAGGVGSIVAQLASKLTNMRVIGTASRDETRAWARRMGASDIIDHHENMPAQLGKLGLTSVDFIFCCYDTPPHFDAMAEMIAPQGRIVAIVPTDEPLPVGELFAGRATFAWEMMFARTMFQTDDMAEQGAILDRVADLIDDGTLCTTLNEDGGPLTADALRDAHQRLDQRTLVGKLAFSMPRD